VSMKRFIDYPVRFMLETDLFAELFEKHDPQIRMIPVISGVHLNRKRRQFAVSRVGIL